MRTLQAIVAVLTLVTFSTYNAQAQKNKTVINPKVGVNLSAVDGKLNDLQAAAKVGWNAGVDFRVGGKKLFLSPGLHFNNYTARLVNDIDTDTQVKFKEETTIQALKAPVNIGFDITGKQQLLNLYLKGGVTPTMILAVSEKAGIPFSKDDLKTFTWGANVGLGMDVSILTVDLNYEIGMSDYFANTTGRNNVLTLSAGIRF
ncbi:outer membrane beta-barrel protein [Haliscomenobacter sp.]|uniref:outer membrane beta-barrel protein n=1 Tax=Haliscomenobacter sp. TaxID=2717303 RepID=UPI003593B404